MRSYIREKRLPHLSYLSVRLSVCLSVSARLALDKFAWNFMFGTFTKFCRETPKFC